MLNNNVIQHYFYMKTLNIKPIDEMGTLWESLTQEERMYLRENTEYVEFKKNNKIYVEGDKPTHLFTLIEGKIKIYKDGLGGRKQIIRLIRQNEALGFAAYFAGHQQRSCAATLENTSCYMVPLSVIQQIIQSNNSLATKFIQTLSAEILLADQRLVSLTQKHIRGRLAETLILLKDYYGTEEDQMTLRSNLSREDVACLSNMTTSNAIRTLSNFTSEEILAIDGRRIKVLDFNTLTKISRLG